MMCLYGSLRISGVRRRYGEGTFSIYTDQDVEVVGCTTCGGCPGGNVEYTGEELIKNGAEVIHLATGLVAGYPTYPYIGTFKAFLEAHNGLKVVVGTHSIPQKYIDLPTRLSTWCDSVWETLIEPKMADETTRVVYN